MQQDKVGIAMLQGALSAGGAYRTRVDGIVGSQTRNAILAQPELAKTAADVVGGEAAALVEQVMAEKSKAVDIADIIRRAADEFSVPVDSAFAKGITESALNPNANNGSFAGLYQMGPPAWQAARQWVQANGHQDIGDYNTNRYDALQNARAAMAYRWVLHDELQKLGVRGPISEADYYLAHQQGAYGLIRLKRAARGVMLDESDRVAMTKAMKSNPPQDGLGVTYDASQFLSRWADVFDDRTAQYASERRPLGAVTRSV